MDNDAFADVLAQARARVGTTLNGKWRLDRLLGVGGMASVYEATHRNRKRGAVKLLHAELSMNGGIRARFLREGYVANSVGHHGAVAVDDDDVTEDGCAFLVMELLEGETLEARWERKGKRLPADDVLSLMDQVLATLAAAHANGIVHRDLKPENLFLTRSGAVKILDFGIARVRELSQQSSKTQTGSMMGTPSFMPPEQARGLWDEVDGQSDLWAVGATMFTLLTGHYVHEASTVNEALAFAVTRPARSVATLVPELLFPVVELVDRALFYQKSDRWPTATTMQTALRRAYAGLEAAAREAGAPALKPITLETFEDATVALGSEAIPPSPAPIVKPGALTTARGVARGALDGALRVNQTTKRAVLGLGLFGAALGAWLGLRHSAATGGGVATAEPQGTAAATAIGTADPPPAPTVRPQGTDVPSVSISQLPIDRDVLSREREPLAHKLRAELEKGRAMTTAAPSATARPSARPETPQGSTRRAPAKSSDDPFLSRH